MKTDARSILTRREFTQRALAAGALAALGGRRGLAAAPFPLRARAKSCILLWLGGGMSHLDTFDPKALGDPATGKPGSAYRSIPTAIPGASVCEHLRLTAPLLDRGVILRTISHPLNIDHADAVNLVKTGRVASGALTFPSLASVITHQLGPRDPEIPPYVVMGMPNVTRGPGFLGAKYGYVYLTDTSAGPTGLRVPPEVTPARDARRAGALDLLRDGFRAQSAAGPAHDYDDALDKARAMVRGKFARVFALDREPESVRARYQGDFGQRCLLARRLVESGARFVEAAYSLNFINGTGWDTHRKGQRNQHLIIQDFDRALSTLVLDLEQRKLLDETLVVVGTEFGRPPEFDNEGGRSHQSVAFSFVMFGGGLRTGQVVGVTDDLGAKVAERPISIPDLHATILAAMGIDPLFELSIDRRPLTLTDDGTPLRELLHDA